MVRPHLVLLAAASCERQPRPSSREKRVGAVPVARVPVDRVLAGPPTIMFHPSPPSLIEGPAALQLALGRWDLGCVLGRAFLLPAPPPPTAQASIPHTYYT